ncbi:hypothetical protein KAI04_03190 [Candidatus Pacearchaeota archaeon]|nr:hypothetical protein [Candidatus Pacearchaeota archaeon]
MGEGNKFKKRAYQTLYKKYKNLFENIQHEAKNKTDHGKDEDKIILLSNIANSEKYSSCGIISKEDIKVIQSLERCLGQHELNAK